MAILTDTYTKLLFVTQWGVYVFLLEHLLKKPLTVVDQFHSHLEPMKFIRRDILNDQVIIHNCNLL